MTDAAEDAALTIEVAAPAALLLVELWEDAADDLAQLIGPLPPACRAVACGDARVLWWEPGAWLVRAPIEACETRRAAIDGALRGRGSATEVSGGFARILVRGTACRELLMFGAVFDAEGGLPDGAVAGTMLHHLPVRLDAVGAAAIDVYVPPSFARELLHHLRTAQARLLLRSDHGAAAAA